MSGGECRQRDPMSRLSDPLLACMLACSDEEAASHWRRWRSSKDLDSIDWRHALMVPMIREERLQRLIAGDPDAPRLTGLVRRAWTVGTTRAALARDLVAQLSQAGIGPVMIGGSLAAFLYRTANGPIRPVTDIVLLMPRHHVDRATSLLRRLQWEPSCAVLPTLAYPWTTFLSMHRGKDVVHVAWRHLGTPPWRSRAVERALFAQPSELLPLESLLLSRLSSGGAWPDTLPWQADLALLAAHPLDWDALLRDAFRFAPDALGRLRAVSGIIRGVPRSLPHAGARPVIEWAWWRFARAAILAARRCTSRR